MLQMNDFVYVENALIVLESASLIYGSVNPQGLLQLTVRYFASILSSSHKPKHIYLYLMHSQF